MSRRGTAASLLREVGGVRRWIAVSALLGAVTVAAGIGLVALSTHLIAMSEVLGTAATMAMVILGVRATAIARVVARYCDRYVGHLATFRVLTRLRVWSFSSLLGAEPLGDDRHPRGEVVTALVDDIETMQDHVLRVAVPPWVAGLSVVVGVAALLAIDGPSAVVLVTTLACATLPAAVILRRLASTSGRAVTDLRAERMAIATADLADLEELVAWGRADHLTDDLDAIERRERPATRRLATVRARADALATIASGLGAVVLTGVALHAPTSDALTWLVAVPMIGLATFEVIGPVLAGAERSASTDAAAARILTLVDDHRTPSRPSPVPVDDVDPRPAVVLDRLSFAFPAGPVIVDDASLTIPWGTTVVVVAPSGTGKSTLVQLLLGLRTPDAGAVRLGTVDVRSIEHEGTRTPVAAVLQDDHLFDTTLRDDVLVGDGDADDDRVRRALDVAGLGALVAERSLDASVGENGADLSGGERQRILLARAVLADAPVLVLDEPAEHLDPERRRAVLDAVLDSRRGRTTIVLAHDADALARADVVLELHGGVLRPRQP